MTSRGHGTKRIDPSAPLDWTARGPWRGRIGGGTIKRRKRRSPDDVRKSRIVTTLPGRRDKEEDEDEDERRRPVCLFSGRWRNSKAATS